MSTAASFACVAVTILLTVLGQIVIKWQVMRLGPMPENVSDKFQALAGLLLNPWVIGSFAAAFVAAMSWIAALTRLDLSYAYPFVSLTFPTVLVLSGIFFHEPIGWQKILGIALILAGVVVQSRA